MHVKIIRGSNCKKRNLKYKYDVNDIATNDRRLSDLYEALSLILQD